MKFSHSLQFNAVPEWSSKYIAYSNLKKLVYQLEKEINSAHVNENSITDTESTAFITQPSQQQQQQQQENQNNGLNTDLIFTKALNNELKKITDFYVNKEKEDFDEFDQVYEALYKFEKKLTNNNNLSDENYEQARISESFTGIPKNVRQDVDILSEEEQDKIDAVQREMYLRNNTTTTNTNNNNNNNSNKKSIPFLFRDTTHADIEVSKQPVVAECTEDPKALVFNDQPTTSKLDSNQESISTDYPENSDLDLRRTRTESLSKTENRRSSILSSKSLKLTTSQNPQARGAWEEFLEDSFNHFYDYRITLKKRIIQLFVKLSELRSYVQLNETGFYKATKKYDKILHRKLKQSYNENIVRKAYPFTNETQANLDAKINYVITMYATLVTHNDYQAAKSELRLNLREYVVWERNTVWRDMIGIERKFQAANIGGRTLLNGENKPIRQGDESKLPAYVYHFGIQFPMWMCSKNFFTLLVTITIFIIMLLIPTFNTPEKSNCFAILVFASLLWATESIPLFVTALIIPFLAVILRVVRDESTLERLSAPDASKFIFSSMWSGVIVLLLGGFTIAAALSKYEIAKIMATLVLRHAGSHPRWILLSNMLVALVSSMFISNVASPVLCISLMNPLLRNLSSDSQFSKALLLGVAFSSNIGGMTSPIASPQNIIALQNMDPVPSWLQWFFVTIPVCLISIILIWGLLLITLPPDKDLNLPNVTYSDHKFTGVQWFISIITIITILLWCITHQIESFVGEMGVVALIPVIVFFGTGLLTKEDFNNFLWTVIILAMGGLALGKAVYSSGLLVDIAHGIRALIDGMELYGIVLVLGGFILVIATFISHTVAAVIVLPLVKEIGDSLAEPHPRLLVMVAGLLCSAAMALPTSGFPNVTAICTTDEVGRQYLSVNLFITRGLPASILAFLVIVTVGFFLMKIEGF